MQETQGTPSGAAGAPPRNPDAPVAPTHRAPTPDRRRQGSQAEGRTIVAPRPSSPPPGRESEPRPEPHVTPNLWGPDAAIMNQPSAVESALADESLRKRKERFSHKTMVAIYIACVIAVIAAVVALIALLSPAPQGIAPLP